MEMNHWPKMLVFEENIEEEKKKHNKKHSLVPRIYNIFIHCQRLNLGPNLSFSHPTQYFRFCEPKIFLDEYFYTKAKFLDAISPKFYVFLLLYIYCWLHWLH